MTCCDTDAESLMEYDPEWEVESERVSELVSDGYSDAVCDHDSCCVGVIAETDGDTLNEVEAENESDED